MTRGHAVAAPATELALDAPTERLCRAVGDGSHAPARLAMIAPGQYGKSALLERIERDRQRAGLPVYRYPAAPAPQDEPELIIVDDAHELAGDDIERLRGYLREERVGVVVAARPRPRPAPLNALLGALRGQIVLRPLELAQIEHCIAARPDNRNMRGFARFVQEQTGGVAGLVTELVGANDAGGAQAGTELPVDAMPACRHELERMPAEVLRFLLAAEAGAGLNLGVLADLFGRTQEEVAELIESARATGFIAADGTLLPVGAQLVRAVAPLEQRAATRHRLAELAVAHAQPVLPIVRSWPGSGIAGAAVANAFQVAAEEAMPGEPALAARMLGAAVEAGTDILDVGARWAEFAALAGELDTAARLADEVIATDTGAARGAGARVAGIALAHRGQLVRSAELLEWAGKVSASAQSSAQAVIGLTGAGRIDDAKRVLAAAETADEPPTLLSGAVFSTARGALESVRGTATSALSELVNAAEMLEPVGADTLLADSPAAIAAMVALHCGEPAVAESVLRSAIDARTGGDIMLTRHRLLLAWAAMLRGDLETAQEGLQGLPERPAPRDWLFAVALEVGIARRASDVAALRKVWGRAREAVIRHPVELFTLLPLGEFAVAAARLGDFERIEPHLRRAHELLACIGAPPLWAGMLQWNGLHAALIAEQVERAGEHAAALAELATAAPHLGTLATAARCWLRALTGDAEPAAVESAAHGLRDAGMCWDGARLAGQAAIHTSDRAAMRELLDCARLLQGGTSAAGARPAEAAGGDEPTGPARLSQREWEVAELILTGMTYKEVGAKLFISPKTVEHHMARMRQRLGAANRAELLAELRRLAG